MALTRRDFLATSVLLPAAGAIGGASVVRAWQQPAPQIAAVFTPIRGDVGSFTGRGGTIGYLINSTGVAVVDSQYRDSAKLCLEGLNERSKNRPVDRLINTHHHGDHTDGNIVFKGDREEGRRPRARGRTHESAAGRGGADDGAVVSGRDVHGPLARAGRRRVDAREILRTGAHERRRGRDLRAGERRAHGRPDVQGTSADHRPGRRRVDQELDHRPRKGVADHSNDTIYIYGHVGANHTVTGPRADLLRLRDYFTALLTFVRAEMTAGKTKEQILANRDTLKGFDDFGAFATPNARSPLTVAYEELKPESKAAVGSCLQSFVAWN